jgi:hypothetical protein
MYEDIPGAKNGEMEESSTGHQSPFYEHSSLLEILRKTGNKFIQRFLTLFPLIYISVLFFMLNGILISKLSLPMVFPEVYPSTPFLNYLVGGGLLFCLFISIYIQTAFLFAVSDKNLHIRDALLKAWLRLPSFILLLLIMMIVIGLGFSLLMIPGIIACVFLSFAPFIFATENIRATEAISKSINYVVHDWLRVFLTLIPIPLLVIFTLFFFAYGGVPILCKTQSVLLFVFIISLVITMYLMLITLYAYQIYDDLRKSRGIILPTDYTTLPSRKPELKVSIPVLSSTRKLSPFFEMLAQAWKIFQKRFSCLSILNLLSYLPHVMNLLLLVVTYLSIKIFVDAFSIGGEFSWLIFLILPKSVLILSFLGLIIFGILYICSAIFGLICYLHLELAFVYAIADDTLTPLQALKKSRDRLKGFSRADLYWKFVTSTGGLLFLPGYMFWVWHEFTPFVFAMQREGQTSLSLLLESRELVGNLWGSVVKRVISLQILPFAIISIIILFIFAGLPFQQIFVLFRSIFTGMPPVGMPSLYDSRLWILIISFLYLYAGLIQIPLQKVFLYLLYMELKGTKLHKFFNSE